MPTINAAHKKASPKNPAQPMIVGLFQNHLGVDL